MSTPDGHPRTLTRQLTIAAIRSGLRADATSTSRRWRARASRLFQRFFRTQRATSAAIPGVGLGLTIAQAIVPGHEGQISVQSLDGQGTTFRIELPLHRTAPVTA